MKNLVVVFALVLAIFGERQIQAKELRGRSQQDRRQLNNRGGKKPEDETDGSGGCASVGESCCDEKYKGTLYKWCNNDSGLACNLSTNLCDVGAPPPFAKEPVQYCPGPDGLQCTDDDYSVTPGVDCVNEDGSVVSSPYDCEGTCQTRDSVAMPWDYVCPGGNGGICNPDGTNDYCCYGVFDGSSYSFIMCY